MSADDRATRTLRPAGWLAPVGYSDGIVATGDGRMVVLAGQIGWNPSTGQFESDEFGAQVEQTLRNIVTLVGEAGGKPSDIVRLTWFVTDRAEYLAARPAIGIRYRSVMGAYYPAMTLVIVAGLVEPRAKVEIEATAFVPAL